MNAPNGPAAPSSGTSLPNNSAPESGTPLPEIPEFATLAADPEIAPLLNFEPVVRKIKRPDGWTDELQRELIARIASTGTVQSAVWQMGKHATGAEALYKVPGAVSFRTSWDAAIIIGRRRNQLDSNPPYAGPVPGIQRRGSGRNQPPGPEPEPEITMSEDQKWDLWSGKQKREPSSKNPPTACWGRGTMRSMVEGSPDAPPPKPRHHPAPPAKRASAAARRSGRAAAPAISG